MALYGIGLSYHHKGQHRQGLSEFQKGYISTGGDPAAVMFMGVTLAWAGRKKAAEKALAKLQTVAKQIYVPAVYPAFIYIALDDLDRAFESLHQACEERSSYMIFLNVQPSFEKLRADPRYRDLLVRMNLTPA
jgi:predicted Zn-dependent protease